MASDSTAAAVAAAWSEVTDAGRSVDRQIESLRSILAVADAEALARGPLGDLVRGTPDYVAGRRVTPAVADELPAWAATSTDSVLSGLHAISILVSRGIDQQSVTTFALANLANGPDDGRVADVVNGLIDDVTERYRQVLFDVGEPEPGSGLHTMAVASPPSSSTGASLALHAEHLTDALARYPLDPLADRPVGPVVVRWTATWLLIAMHVAEIRGWVQAVRALYPAAEPWA